MLIIFFNRALDPIWSYNLQIVVRGATILQKKRTSNTTPHPLEQLYGSNTNTRDSVSVFVTFYFTQTNPNTKHFKIQKATHTHTTNYKENYERQIKKKLLTKLIQEVLTAFI